MNAVAERLRKRNTPYGWASLAETAAVEIDRLEVDKAAISQTASDYLHEIERLKALVSTTEAILL